jgi:hypothetical protein
VKSRLPDPRDRLALGPARIPVSPICLGMVSAPEILIAAFDAGVNFFFVTCDLHWPVYAPVREGLAALLARGDVARGDIAIAAASYVTQPEFSRAPFRELLEEVPALERLDLLVIGGAYGGELDGRLRAYRQNLSDGLGGAAALGASFHDRAAAVRAINQGAVDLAFVRYNPLHPGARDDLFPALDPAAPALVYNFNSTRGAELTGPVDAGEMWIPRVPDYYRFVLSRPEVDGLLCAFDRAEEIAALVAALAEGPLSEEEQSYMVELVAEVQKERDALLRRR